MNLKKIILTEWNNTPLHIRNQISTRDCGFRYREYCKIGDYCPMKKIRGNVYFCGLLGYSGIKLEKEENEQ